MQTIGLSTVKRDLTVWVCVCVSQNGEEGRGLVLKMRTGQVRQPVCCILSSHSSDPHISKGASTSCVPRFVDKSSDLRYKFPFQGLPVT